MRWISLRHNYNIDHMTLSERDSKVIWHPYTQMQTASLPVAIVRGEGARLYDENGKEYIDAIASWWVNVHGHANQYIADKMSEQLRKLEHVIFAGFTHQPAVELAERLLKVLPPNQSWMFFSDNGSTAVEVALKMALQYWYNQGVKRRTIVALNNSYHGELSVLCLRASATFLLNRSGIYCSMSHLSMRPSKAEKRNLLDNWNR